jgi:hypothetical protein
MPFAPSNLLILLESLGSWTDRSGSVIRQLREDLSYHAPEDAGQIAGHSEFGTSANGAKA